MSPVPTAIEEMRRGVGSAVTTTMCGTRPLRSRSRLSASVRVFCARSLRMVHLHDMLAWSARLGSGTLLARHGVSRFDDSLSTIDFLIRRRMLADDDVWQDQVVSAQCYANLWMVVSNS